jgi:hypothetical protein
MHKVVVASCACIYGHAPWHFSPRHCVHAVCVDVSSCTSIRVVTVFRSIDTCCLRLQPWTGQHMRWIAHFTGRLSAWSSCTAYCHTTNQCWRKTGACVRWLSRVECFAFGRHRFAKPQAVGCFKCKCFHRDRESVGWRSCCVVRYTRPDGDHSDLCVAAAGCSPQNLCWK